MAKVVKCKTLDGQSIEFVEDVIGSGAMKDVHFAPDKSYVVAFYKEKQDFQARDRLQMITGRYREALLVKSVATTGRRCSAGRRPRLSMKASLVW